MPLAQPIIQSSVVIQGDKIYFYAHLVQGDGVVVLNSLVSTATASAFKNNDTATDLLSAADVKSSVESIEQTGEGWPYDDVGYTFKHELLAATLDSTQQGGDFYRIEYTFTMTVGDIFHAIHEVTIEPLYTS